MHLYNFQYSETLYNGQKNVENFCGPNECMSDVNCRTEIKVLFVKM